MARVLIQAGAARSEPESYRGDLQRFCAMIFAACVMATVMVPAELAQAQVSVDIGIHLGSPPRLVAVPESPVMYAPAVNRYFFFYAGQYYVYRRGAWYVGARHNGPWAVVRPEFVPRPILSVPVKYYRVPPPEWKGWHAEAAPRWQPTYGRRWEEHPPSPPAPSPSPPLHTTLHAAHPAFTRIEHAR